VLLDFGDPRHQMVDLFREAGVACALLFEPLDAAVDDGDLGGNVADLFVHMLEPIRHL